jgi:hypothetical protein
VTTAWDKGFRHAKSGAGDEVPSQSDIVEKHGCSPMEATLFVLGFLEGRGATIGEGTREIAEEMFRDDA